MIPGLAAVLPPHLAGYAPNLAVGAGRGQVRAAVLVRDRAAHAAAAGAFARRYPGADERAVLSYWAQHYFAALIVPALAAAVRLRRVLPLGLDAVGCDLDRHGVPQRFWLEHGGVTRPAGAPEEGLAVLAADHLRPFIHGCAQWSGLSPRVLWCNAGAVLDFAARELAAGAPGGPVHRSPDADALLLDPFRATPDGARRRHCCLRLRLPGVARCSGICPLGERSGARP